MRGRRHGKSEKRGTAVKTRHKVPLEKREDGGMGEREQTEKILQNGKGRIVAFVFARTVYLEYKSKLK